MNHDVIRIDTIVSNALGLKPDTDRIARADGKMMPTEISEVHSSISDMCPNWKNTNMTYLAKILRVWADPQPVSKHYDLTARRTVCIPLCTCGCGGAIGEDNV
jgi:hypothetical protein